MLQATSTERIVSPARMVLIDVLKLFPASCRRGLGEDGKHSLGRRTAIVEELGDIRKNLLFVDMSS